MSELTTVSFGNINLEIIDHNGQQWLLGNQIAEALGYKDSKSVNRIYSRNSDEFDSSTTSVVNLTPSGKSDPKYDTRVFSRRGTHLLGMFARTEKAKPFRKWVLNILDEATMYQQAALPSTITPKQKLAIRDAMNKKVYDNYGKKQIPTGFKTEWHDFYEAFEISAYAELPLDRFDDAMGYILGEWMPETQQAAIGDDMIVVNKANYEAQQQLTKMLCERMGGLEKVTKEIDYLESSIHLTLSIAKKSHSMVKELEYLTHDVVRDLKVMRPKVALA